MDGFHTHDTAIKIAYSTHPSGCVLVSDAMAAMGLPSGRHSLGTIDVTISKERRATVSDSETLAGSAASLDECVRRFADLVGPCRAIEAATLHPARMLGIEKTKGVLEYGADADFILLTDDLYVEATYIAGEEVWRQ